MATTFVFIRLSLLPSGQRGQKGRTIAGTLAWITWIELIDAIGGAKAVEPAGNAEPVEYDMPGAT
jgi:hypothetical protein